MIISSIESEHFRDEMITWSQEKGGPMVNILSHLCGAHDFSYGFLAMGVLNENVLG